jgi:hypothetical protein
MNELAPFNCLSEVVLNNVSVIDVWLVDYHISKSNVIALAGHTTSNTHHQAKPDSSKAESNLVCNYNRRDFACFPSWMACNDNIVVPNAAQDIVILSAECCGRGACLSSSIAIAAAISLGRAQIHPTV